jgi:riboflavin synthase
MFSGIIESVEKIVHAEILSSAVRVWINKPPFFDDLKHGDSIAVNGICLTVEEFSSEKIQFTMAAETLKVLGWYSADSKTLIQNLINKKVNLERSMRLGDRIHGHLVSGHVEGLAQVVKTLQDGDSFFIYLKLPEALLRFVWQKGSITINGVSLTLNELENDQIQLCLIPETVKRTNLGDIQNGDLVTVEPDLFAKAVQRALQFDIGLISKEKINSPDKLGAQK